MLSVQTERARQLLGSQRWADKAWGAYFAGRLRLQGIRDVLIEQLRFQEPLRNAPRDGEEYSYVQALLDALIELGGPVPADVVMPFRSQWRAEVLILLARGEGNEDPLLAMRDEELSDTEWVAVNNLLLGMRSQTLFRKTLEELRITHRFVVIDDATAGFGPGFGSGGSVGPGDHRIIPEGFPPTPRYQLQTYPADGDVLLAKGPHNVYFRRIVPVRRSFYWNATSRVTDRQRYRLEYAAEIGPSSAEGASLMFSPWTTLRWHSPEHFSSEVDRHLAVQAEQIRGFLAAAVQRGFVELRGLRLQIIPEIEDRRQGVRQALPQVAFPREITLQ